MATAAAAIIAKARRRILDHLMMANAVSPETAVGYEPNSIAQRRQFERLQGAGVIKEARTGEYWLDIPAYRDWANRRRRRIIALMVVVVIAVALGALVSAGVGGIAR